MTFFMTETSLPENLIYFIIASNALSEKVFMEGLFFFKIN